MILILVILILVLVSLSVEWIVCYWAVTSLIHIYIGDIELSRDWYIRSRIFDAGVNPV